MSIAGAFGLVYIATVAWVVRTVGVLVTSLLTLVGLLAGSVVMDLVAPTAGSAVTWQLLAGVALTWLAVLLASRPSRR
jgi:transporter family-2 protein